jgi:hypothetical protein
LSRFENGIGIKELYRLGEALAVSVIRRHAERLRRRAYRVTIDLDPTDDPTHGAQQLSFFNGHYDTWCYLCAFGVAQVQIPAQHRSDDRKNLPIQIIDKGGEKKQCGNDPP